MNESLQNIPGIWTGISHGVALLLYVGLMPAPQAKDRRFWLWAAIAAAAECGFMWAIAGLSGMAFNLAMTIAAMLPLLPLLLCCHLRWQTAVYTCARAFILAGFTASLAWQVYIYSAQSNSALAGLPGQIVLMTAIYAAVFGLMYLLERQHRRDLEEMTVSTLSCAATVAMAFTIYFVSSMAFASFENPFSSVSRAEMFNIRTMIYFGGVALLYALHVQLCDNHARTEVTVLQSILEAQYNNYRISQESVDLVNRKYHDLKHQIAVLRSEIGSQEKLESLDRMEEEIRIYEAQNKTGNGVLDTILTSKSLFCQGKDIQLNCIADGSALDFMDTMDICSLFGNALDNAIEAVSQLPDPKQRLISLSVSRQKGFLRIRVENRCGEDLVIQSGGKLPDTTKRDHHLHGYGLKSIHATAEKYGGSAAVSAANGLFELGVLIPLENQPGKNEESDGAR